MPLVIPRPLSKGEEVFAFQCKHMLKVQPEREYRFFDGRRWRFDFAWPEARLAVEIEGGSWVRGAHNRGVHFEADCEKYSTAAAMGWRVIRGTTDQALEGKVLGWVILALNEGLPEEVLCETH